MYGFCIWRSEFINEIAKRHEFALEDLFSARVSVCRCLPNSDAFPLAGGEEKKKTGNDLLRSDRFDPLKEDGCANETLFLIWILLRKECSF
ncbi:hypothetical protein CDAR_514361 [Caerostris darwini]|uniref:Uncharacterized protein n=1 Tax=Caerostris darwini TaxID=1538125 RepID=A0AAV4UNJ9_9ARAC|nr:hypothetical protein CDAR_514361 [Caerostris darwini]